MLDRVEDKFDLHPERLIAGTAYGTGPLLGWLVDRKIVPHIPVFDKSGRNDGIWTHADFEWDAGNDQYICPGGHTLRQFRRNYSDPNRGQTGKGTACYRALKKSVRPTRRKPSAARTPMLEKSHVKNTKSFMTCSNSQQCKKLPDRRPSPCRQP